MRATSFVLGLVMVVLLGMGRGGVCAAGAGGIGFNRDVRPILADKCFACHGPDENHRKAGLRLDVKEGVLAERGGERVVVPGDPSRSGLVGRIKSADADALMPPPKSGKSLSTEQVATLVRWIEEGALWQEHWAFVPPQRVEPSGLKWFGNPIDYFILQRLKAQGLKPSPEASKETLIRRVTLR